MGFFSGRMTIVVIASLVAIVGFIWWQSSLGVPGDIPMGDDSNATELISLAIAVVGAFTAVVNLIIAFVKLKSEKDK